MPSSDVLIVGAGAAGLAAARTLTRAGFHVTILEARQRLGGRIHTIQDPLSAIPVELGAEFVHGKPSEIWHQVEAGRLPAIELAAPQDSPATKAILAGTARAPEQSFRAYVEGVDASDDAKQDAIGFVEGFNAARQERISVQSIAQSQEASGQIEGSRMFRLLGGYGRLVDCLWRGIEPDRRKIVFGAVVEAVEWKRGEVRIATERQQFTAPRAIVTVPLGVLKSGAIRFDPEPPILRDACDRLEMGAAVRVVLRFRRPIWEDRPDLREAGFLEGDDPWMPVWWTGRPVHAPFITGWCGGPCAEAAALDPSEWIPSTLESLARRTGIGVSTLAGELQSWHAHNWSADPYSCGAYSYVGVGGMPAYERFGDPVEDTLYFAGEAVDTRGHIGTVHGALASGERAASRIVYH